MANEKAKAKGKKIGRSSRRTQQVPRQEVAKVRAGSIPA